MQFMPMRCRRQAAAQHGYSNGSNSRATCIATRQVVIAVLDRENLARIIVEQPLLGAKILMELVLMLSQRLRATSQRLLGLLDEQAHGATSGLL